ncbi:hypothetical protein SEA_JFLIX2_33 [Rhodococcus phage Jflix2]|nr:hypothetical protein SEA_JFLIX2_33 [Rhodococcus phage Jflix2]
MPPRKKSAKWQRQHNSHLTTDYPRKSKCGRCGRVVLAGAVFGLDTRFDPYLLNQLGEVDALLQGLRTFYAHHPTFAHRTTSMIRREPIPKMGYIIREHRCDVADPPPHLQTQPVVHEIPADAPPPF